MVIFEVLFGCHDVLIWVKVPPKKASQVCLSSLFFVFDGKEPVIFHFMCVVKLFVMSCIVIFPAWCVDWDYDFTFINSMTFYLSRVISWIVAYAKTKPQISCAVTAQLISAFVFAPRIMQSLFYLNPKFQASSLLPRLYRPISVRPGRKLQRPVFLLCSSFIILTIEVPKLIIQ